MKTASIILLWLYCALMFATLFVKNDKLKFSKILAILGIVASVVHTVLYYVSESHWTILLASLALFLAYAIANGLIMKKPHILHWMIRFVCSTVIFLLFVI